MDRPSCFDFAEFNREKSKCFIVNYGSPRFSEVDRYKMLWNGHIINYFEDATETMFSNLVQKKITSALHEEKGVLVAICDYTVKMRSPVAAKDNMSVVLRPLSFKYGIVEFEQALMVEGKVKFYGKINYILVDAKTMTRLYPVPEYVKKEMDNMFAVFNSDKKEAPEKRKPVELGKEKSAPLAGQA